MDRDLEALRETRLHVADIVELAQLVKEHVEAGGFEDAMACLRLIEQHTSLGKEALGQLLPHQTASESRILRAALEACAQACSLCGDDCERHAQHGTRDRQACAEACSRCESACNNAIFALKD